MQALALQHRNILEATEALPIIGDGDTGFGNALSVKRTVQGFANAGFAGILIEDQVRTLLSCQCVLCSVSSIQYHGLHPENYVSSIVIFDMSGNGDRVCMPAQCQMSWTMQAAPKSCGHVRGKKVVSRGEAVARIRAAVDARDESGSNIVVVARTDARQADSLDVSGRCLWILPPPASRHHGLS